MHSGSETERTCIICLPNRAAFQSAAGLRRKLLSADYSTAAEKVSSRV